MFNEQGYGLSGLASDDVQDVGMQRVSRSSDGVVHGQGRGRYLRVGPLLFHNRHLQGGRKTARGCGVCAKGLEGAMAPVEKRRGAEVPLVEGDRADGEETAARSPGGRAGGRQNEVLWE